LQSGSQIATGIARIEIRKIRETVCPSGGKTGHRIENPRKNNKILTLPVAQQWHLSDRRTPRVHKTLHVGDEFLFFRAGLPFAPSYPGQGRSSDRGYH